MNKEIMQWYSSSELTKIHKFQGIWLLHTHKTKNNKFILGRDIMSLGNGYTSSLHNGTTSRVLKIAITASLS